MFVHILTYKFYIKSFLSFSTTSAESTATTMACEERPEHHHSWGRSLLRPGSSYCPQCSHKSHSGPLVTWLQWACCGGCCLGWCHKVNYFRGDISVHIVIIVSTVVLKDYYMCFFFPIQANRVWSFHGWLASGEGDETPSVTGRVGGWVFQIPTVPWIQNVSLELVIILKVIHISNSQTKH